VWEKGDIQLNKGGKPGFMSGGRKILFEDEKKIGIGKGEDEGRRSARVEGGRESREWSDVMQRRARKELSSSNGTHGEVRRAEKGPVKKGERTRKEDREVPANGAGKETM